MAASVKSEGISSWKASLSLPRHAHTYVTYVTHRWTHTQPDTFAWQDATPFYQRPPLQKALAVFTLMPPTDLLAISSCANVYISNHITLPVSLREKHNVPRASRTRQYALTTAECTGVYWHAGQGSSVNSFHSHHLWSSKGARHRIHHVYDGFGCFVCVFMTLSFQNIIVQCGLILGFFLCVWFRWTFYWLIWRHNNHRVRVMVFFVVVVAAAVEIITVI